MMKTELSDTLGIACVKKVCPICCKEIDSAIIMNSKLTKSAAEQVNKLHGKTIGFRETPCNECQKHIDNGVFFVIGIDTSKTKDMKNPYRSGHIVGLKKDCEFVKDAISRMPKDLKNKYAMYMDYNDMIALGVLPEK